MTTTELGTTLGNLKAELAKARLDQARVHALGQRDHAAYIASLVRAIRREEEALTFYDTLLDTMLADENYGEDGEDIREIHVENYTEDLSAWISAQD